MEAHHRLLHHAAAHKQFKKKRLEKIKRATSWNIFLVKRGSFTTFCRLEGHPSRAITPESNCVHQYDNDAVVIHHIFPIECLWIKHTGQEIAVLG